MDIYNANYSGSTILTGTSSNDSIWNGTSDNVTIVAGAGNDTIFAGGDYVTISADSGDDYIYTYGSYATIYPGQGNDTVSIYGGGYTDHNIIQYQSGDGNDIIYNFSAADTLNITGGTYSSTTSDDDVIVNVGSGEVTLQGAGSLSQVNIDGTSATASSSDWAGTSSVSSQYISYSGGNMTSSYSEGQQVNIATDFTGVAVDGDNFIVKSSSGQLTLQNVRGKFVKYGNSAGTPLAYSYLGTNGSGSSGSSVNNSYSSYDSVNNSYNNYNTIDMTSRGSSLYGVLIGGDSANDSIIAGAGGSSMWGGSGGNDTLVGGSGYDEFVYKIGSGNDVIQNAGSSDVVNLEGIELSQIVSANVSSSEIYASFSDGGRGKFRCRCKNWRVDICR